MSFRVEPRGQGSRERHDLWVEFPISGLKTQAVSPPSHPGTVGPVLSNSLSVFFADAEENPPCVTCCPWDLRYLRERQLCLQNCFLNSSSCLGAQPTQGNHLILLLTAALAAVSLPPKCLITVNAPLPVPTATSSAQASWPGASAVSLGCPHQLGPLLSPLPPSVAHSIDSVDVCHTTHTSFLNPGWEVQLSPSPNPSMVPWEASCGPRSPSSFPSTLDGCAGPGLCAEYIWDTTLQIVQILLLDCWLLLS